MPPTFLPLDRLLLGNPLADWLSAGAMSVAVGLLLYVMKHVLGRKLAAIATRTSTQVDDAAAALLSRTRFYFILALALRAGATVLVLSPVIREALQDVTSIAVLLQLARWGTGLITFWLHKWARTRDGGDERATSATINAIGALARGLLWTVVALLALKNVWDFDISALITGLGVGGIAIALAVQNILGDAFAALSIVLDKPFDVGDTIAVDSVSGTVEHIGLKTTRIRAIGGEQIIFSNADLLKSRVRNLQRMVERRVTFVVGVAYDTPADQVERIPTMIEEIVGATPNARFDRAHFTRFADSALEFEVAYFVAGNDYRVYADAQQAVNLGILRRFSDERIGFAFTTRRIIHIAGEGAHGEHMHRSTAPAADA